MHGYQYPNCYPFLSTSSTHTPNQMKSPWSSARCTNCASWSRRPVAVGNMLRASSSHLMCSWVCVYFGRWTD